MVFIVVSGFLLVLAVAILAVLLVWSWPGKPKPFLDENGRPLPDSISEKVRVDINGFEQGMFLTAKDKTKPVLLFLHGGMPEYFLSQRYPTGLEAEFAVCWWEQRGAGLSWRPGMSPESVTVGQLVADTIALTNDLRRRSGKDLIYLMGHSGGSFLGRTCCTVPTGWPTGGRAVGERVLNGGQRERGRDRRTLVGPALE